MSAKAKHKQAKPKSKSVSKIWILFILLLTVLAYSSGLEGEILLFDDNEYFEKYPEIVDLSWKSVKAYFSNYYVLMYHPLPMLTLATNYAITGLDSTPMHIFNLLFHLLNIALVYLLSNKFLRDYKEGALLVAAMFALHPMATEAVTWISARSSVMYVFFFLLGLLAYLKYINQTNKYQWLFFAWLAFLLSCFSKANAIPFSVLLVLVDWYYRRKWHAPKVLLEKLPFLALSVIFGLVAISNSGTGDNMTLITERFEGYDNIFFLSYSLAFYVIKYFVPFNLSAIHTYPEKIYGLLPWEYYVAPLFLVFLILALSRYRKDRTVLFGLGFFIIIIGVTLQVIPSRLFIVADRYPYLPYVGFSLILAHWLKKTLSSENRVRRRLALRLKGLWVFILALFMILTFERNKVWTSTEALVSDIIDKNPPVPYIARAYGQRGLLRERKGEYKAALADYNKCLQIKPNDGKALFNRAVLFFKSGQLQKARVAFTESLEHFGEYYDTYNYLGLIAFQNKEYETAVGYYNKAIEKKPNFALGYSNRGAAYGMLKQYEKALDDFNEAVQLQPNSLDAIKNRAKLHLKLNNRAQACADLSKAKLMGAKDVDNLLELNNCNKL